MDSNRIPIGRPDAKIYDANLKEPYDLFSTLHRLNARLNGGILKLMAWLVEKIGVLPTLVLFKIAVKAKYPKP